jgi:hypothetical protein
MRPPETDTKPLKTIMRKRKYLKNAGCALALFLLAVGSGTAGAADYSVPPLINYQGKLTDAAGHLVPDGQYRVAFRIWNSLTDTGVTNLMWGHEYDVPLSGGAFNVILGTGSGSPISGAVFTNLGFAFAGPNRYLGLTLVRDAAGNTVTNAQETTPRQQILSAPFALTSGNGLPIGGIMPWLPTNTFTSLAEVQALVPVNFRLCKGPNPDEQDDARTLFDETLIPDFMDERFVVGGPPELAGSKAGSAEHIHSYTITTDGENGDGKMGSVDRREVYYSVRHHSHLVSGQTQPAVVTPKYLGVLFIIRVN